MMMLCALSCGNGNGGSVGARSGTPTESADSGSVSMDASGTAGDADNDTSAEDSRPLTPLDQVAQIVAPNCAVAGCHDSITHEHGMDLSTPASIYGSWVNQKGLDH